VRTGARSNRGGEERAELRMMRREAETRSEAACAGEGKTGGRRNLSELRKITQCLIGNGLRRGGKERLVLGQVLSLPGSGEMRVGG
jgi:hypothetical protein